MTIENLRMLSLIAILMVTEKYFPKNDSTTDRKFIPSIVILSRGERR